MTPQDIQEWIVERALMDERDHNAGGSLNVSFRGKPSSIYLHSNIPSALENAKAGRKWLIVTRSMVESCDIDV